MSICSSCCPNSAVIPPSVSDATWMGGRSALREDEKPSLPERRRLRTGVDGVGFNPRTPKKACAQPQADHGDRDTCRNRHSATPIAPATRIDLLLGFMPFEHALPAALGGLRRGHCPQGRGNAAVLAWNCSEI